MVNHYDVHVIFQNIEHLVFYKVFIKFGSILDPLEIIRWKLLRHCPIA